MGSARWFAVSALIVAAACGARTNNTAGEGSGATGRASPNENVGGTSAGKEPNLNGGGSDAPQGGADGEPGTGTTGVAQPPGSAGEAGSASGCICNERPDCGPGFVVSLDPNRCCRCVIECASVGCLDLDCAEGTHAAQEDDECCPSCVADQPLSCEEARRRYDQYRAELLAPYQESSCKSDEDCSRFTESNRCRSSCATPLDAQGSRLVEDALLLFAEQHCTSCPKPEALPCPRLFPPRCLDGLCQ